jgi:hypothetical protein
MMSLCFLFLGCMLFISSHFHHPDMCFFNLDCMFLFPVTQECLYFVACMFLIYFQILALSPFNHCFLLGSVYFFTLFDQVTYFTYIVGKSTPFSIILESLVV